MLCLNESTHYTYWVTRPYIDDRLDRPVASQISLEAIGARSKARLGPAHSHLETMWCLVCTETRLTFLCWRHGINPFLFSWTEQDENQGQKFWFEGMCFFPQITSILFLFPIRSEHHFCLHASEVRTLHVDRNSRAGHAAGALWAASFALAGMH